MHPPYAAGILLLAIYLREMKTNVHIQLSMNTYSRLIHDSHKLETVQKSMNRWMRRQLVIHPHSETPLPNKRGWITPKPPHWVAEVRCIRVPTQGPHLCETPEMMNLTLVNRKNIRGCRHLRLWGNFWGVMNVLILDCLTGHCIKLYTKQVFYCA